MFTHLEPPSFEDIKTKNIHHKRYYVTPEENYYPSITTVLSLRNKQGLMEWRKRVGEDVANYVARTASIRGTAVHKMCEDYLNNDTENFDDYKKKKFLPWCLFSRLKEEVLHKIDNIHAQELALWSDEYQVAGRVDCIADYNGVLSIIDFKTSSKPRSDAWNENYYIQGSAYAEMYEERTGIAIDQVVILVVTEDGSVQEFVKQKHEYLPMLSEAVAEWKEHTETLEVE